VHLADVELYSVFVFEAFATKLARNVFGWIVDFAYMLVQSFGVTERTFAIGAYRFLGVLWAT